MSLVAEDKDLSLAYEKYNSFREDPEVMRVYITQEESDMLKRYEIEKRTENMKKNVAKNILKLDKNANIDYVMKIAELDRETVEKIKEELYNTNKQQSSSNPLLLKQYDIVKSIEEIRMDMEKAIENNRMDMEKAIENNRRDMEKTIERLLLKTMEDNRTSQDKTIEDDRKDVAKNILKLDKNADIDYIMKITELDRKTVEQIKEELYNTNK